MSRYIVTGASYGIGRAVAARLKSEGHDVFGLQRTQEVHGLQRRDSASPHGYKFVETDFEDSASIKDAVQRLKTELNGLLLKGIVLNAGVQERDENQWDVDQWHRHMQINCFGQALLVEELLSAQLICMGFSLVFMGSFLSAGSDRFPAYAMSKAAMQAYLDSLYSRMRKNIHLTGQPCFNTVWPGRCNTPGNPKRELPDDDPNPYKEPEEVARTVVYLLGESGSTGWTQQVIDLGAS